MVLLSPLLPTLPILGWRRQVYNFKTNGRVKLFKVTFCLNMAMGWINACPTQIIRSSAKRKSLKYESWTWTGDHNVGCNPLYEVSWRIWQDCTHLQLRTVTKVTEDQLEITEDRMVGKWSVLITGVRVSLLISTNRGWSLSIVGLSRAI